MTTGPRLFEGFAVGGVFAFLAALVCQWADWPGPFFAFGWVGVLCTAAAFLSWFICWLWDLFTGGWW